MLSHTRQTTYQTTRCQAKTESDRGKLRKQTAVANVRYSTAFAWRDWGKTTTKPFPISWPTFEHRISAIKSGRQCSVGLGTHGFNWPPAWCDVQQTGYHRLQELQTDRQTDRQTDTTLHVAHLFHRIIDTFHHNSRAQRRDVFTYHSWNEVHKTGNGGTACH
jgi:hypothetical protein